jgi:post-segregation antitoxin (ccd killing protein)
MANNPADSARLNIYVSRQLWRRVKLAAAARDVSVSTFCAEAIEARLEEAPGESDRERRRGAIANARKFKEAHFGSTTLNVSTADLLRPWKEEGADR